MRYDGKIGDMVINTLMFENKEKVSTYRNRSSDKGSKSNNRKIIQMLIKYMIIKKI